MLIFWEQRLVFLATPKAGSTAIEAALEPLASAAILRPAPLKHTNIAQFHRHLGPWLEAQANAPFSTVALMREPVDWLRSWYRFRQRDDHEDAVHDAEDTSFARFAADYSLLDGPDRLSIGRQRDFLIDGAGRVDQIFRYEDFAAFVDYLEDRLNCALEMPRLNVPPSADVELDDADEVRLREAMWQDMELYRSL